MRRVVRGFWGPRVESVEELAVRWKKTLDRLAELLPDAGAGTEVDGTWTWQQVHTSGPATTELRPDEVSLVAALRAERDDDGWSDRTGYGLHLVVTGEHGWEIATTSRAGGTSEFLLQSMVIAVESPDDADIPDAELLTAVADAWEPDFGDVSDYDVFDALEDEAGFSVGEPSVGWIGYLSPGRAALVPTDLEAGGMLLRDESVVLEIAPRSDTEAVVRANLLLRDAGALKPLPRPMDLSRLDPFASDTARAVAEVDSLLAGPVPEVETCATATLWEGPWLMGVYDEEWTAASTTAHAHLAAVTDALDRRWGAHRSVGMRVPIFRKVDGTPMPPLFQTLVDSDLLGDLSVWGPVGDKGRYVGLSLNQCDGDAPMIVAAVVSEHPIVELGDEG